MGKSRREFLKAASATAVGAVISNDLLAGNLAKGNGRPLCAFTKCLQFVDFEKTGETLAFAGFDGADIPVRPGGSILPESVGTELPKAVKTLKKYGITVPMIVTAIVDADDPLTERVLGAASEAGIRYYRTGYLIYDPAKTIQENLDNHKRTIEKLERLNRKFNIHGAYQNHSGTRIGGPVWDLYWLVKDCDPEYFGIQYDFCHAMVEGGVSWPLGMKLLAPWIKTVDIKDFVWTKADGKWKIACVPLGDGMVDFDACLKQYILYHISGPFSLHFEYGPAEGGLSGIQSDIRRQEMANVMKKDFNWFTEKLDSHKII